ncbi:MAG TPA: S-layer homology domain-containing protein [Candidatus Gracilibacteria bacterium]|nr:S-layer homology domain-containing protein [Candidatus Gracilibacteria bacterium]
MFQKSSQSSSSHRYKVQSMDSATIRFERWIVMALMFAAIGFLGYMMADIVLPKTQASLHGAPEKPSFEFEDLDYMVFADVSGTDEHAYALAYLKGRGMILGYEDGTFLPDETMDRATFMKMLTGAKQVHPHRLRYGWCYPDVQGEWFAPSVCFGKDRGWLEGSSDQPFGPGENITRADALKIAMRAFDVDMTDGQRSSTFADVGNDSYYSDYIVAAEEKGLLDGFIDGPDFQPDKEMTRAEVAEMLFRIVYTEMPVL